MPFSGPESQAACHSRAFLISFILVFLIFLLLAFHGLDSSEQCWPVTSTTSFYVGVLVFPPHRARMMHLGRQDAVALRSPCTSSGSTDVSVCCLGGCSLGHLPLPHSIVNLGRSSDDVMGDVPLRPQQAQPRSPRWLPPLHRGIICRSSPHSCPMAPMSHPPQRS